MKPMPLSKAKARFSSLIDRLIHLKERVLITKRGKPVAVLIPFEDWQRLQTGTSGGLASVPPPREDLDFDLGAMIKEIYNARRRSKARTPAL